MGNKSTSPGRKLLSALTQDQVASLLDTVGSQTLLDKVKQEHGKIDSDVVDTVKSVLESGEAKKTAKSKAGRLTSDGRLIQDWQDLWQRWDDVIGEIGDEEGKYVQQDQHWEEPYFDGSAAAIDLEEIAPQMLKMIDDVFNLVNDSSLFTNAIDGINEAIKSYPEWMGADGGDGCSLESQTTHCVLKWLWLSSKDAASPGAEFLKRIEKVEHDSESVSLDRDATADFITGLSEPVCREIHEELRNGRFQKEQENAYSQWNAIAHELERRYDKGLYLERCGRDLEKNWHNGEPLIKKAMAEGDWKATESWLAKTITVYRHWKSKPEWYPEQSLLIAGDQVWRDTSETTEVAKLLEVWSTTSEKLGNPERSAAARFQAVTTQDPEKLERIIEEFREIRKGKSFPSLDSLFKQWQDEIVQRSLPVYNHEGRFPDTWIHWAIIARAKGNDKKQFRDKLDTWLNSLLQNSGDFKKQWELLSYLTLDMTDAASLRKEFPGLFKTALERFGKNTALGKERSAIVGKLCRPGTTNVVMQIWKQQLENIVPDPSTSSNDYLNPVSWAKALFDLNPDAYSHLVKRWLIEHHRRRNLWKAMHDAKLPVPGQGL
jgi:hypothetical protein